MEFRVFKFHSGPSLWRHRMQRAQVNLCKFNGKIRTLPVALCHSHIVILD